MRYAGDNSGSGGASLYSASGELPTDHQTSRQTSRYQCGDLPISHDSAHKIITVDL